jgi:hypothetical protein
MVREGRSLIAALIEALGGWMADATTPAQAAPAPVVTESVDVPW